MKASPNFLNYTIIGASSEDPNWPVANLKSVDSSTMAYRSLVTTQTTVDFDFGFAISPSDFFLYRANFIQATLLGNASQSWGSPPFTQGITIERDPDLRIYKFSKKMDGFNYRYGRLVIPVQATTDGAPYFELGIFGIPQNVELFQGRDQFGFPLDTAIMIHEQRNELGAGRKEIIPLSPLKTRSIGLSGNFKDTVAFRDKFHKTFTEPLKSTIWIDRETGNTWEFYIVQRMGNVPDPKIAPNQRRSSVALETIL